jgi:predicted amidophosphoribosyltransferase
VCTTRLKQACANCNAPLEALWQVCPFCETPVESTGLDLPVVEARPRRRRRSTSK